MCVVETEKRESEAPPLPNIYSSLVLFSAEDIWVDEYLLTLYVPALSSTNTPSCESLQDVFKEM